MSGDPAGKRERRRRNLAIAGIVILAAASVGLTLFGNLFYVIHCTDGDGGAPYVARDSAQKDVCDATGNGSLLLLAMLALIGVFAFLAWRGFKAWRSGSRGLAAFVLCLVAIPSAPLIAFLAANSPSDYCSDAKKAAAEAAPSSDCEHY